MIFDGFLFHSEFEMLKLRCEELKPLNVTHILVESPQAHSGRSKPCHFNERRHEFSQYKIIHKIVPRTALVDSWSIEKWQRNLIVDDIQDGDTWLITDADEIPRASAIRDWKGDCAELSMKGYRYFLNREPHDGWWHHARLCSGKYLKTTTPHAMRQAGCPEAIPNAGWHFSWMGGLERIQDKLRSFAHVELNTERLRSDQPWLDDFAAVPYHPVDDTYPEYLVNNQNEFAHMIHHASGHLILDAIKRHPKHNDIGP